MRVDVRHLVRVQARVGQHAADGENHPGAVRLRLGDVVRVGRVPHARGDRVYGGPAARRVLGGLEHDHACALAEDESVPALVERARGAFRLVVPGGQGAHGRERGDVQLNDRGLGPAGQHQIGAAGPDHLQPVADRLGTGRACADRGVHAGAGAELDADPPRGAVRHQHRDRERREPLPAFLPQRVVGGQGRGDAADAAGDHHAEPLRLDLGSAGIGPRLARRDERELLAPVQAAGLDPVHQAGRVGGGPAGNAGGQLAGPVLGQLRHAAASGQQRVPGRGDVGSHRRDRAEPGDDDVRPVCAHCDRAPQVR